MIIQDLSSKDLEIGERYNFKHQSERLKYVGTYGPWYQFEKVGEVGKIWCELLSNDLGMLEKTNVSD